VAVIARLAEKVVRKIRISCMSHWTRWGLKSIKKLINNDQANVTEDSYNSYELVMAVELKRTSVPRQQKASIEPKARATLPKTIKLLYKAAILGWEPGKRRAETHKRCATCGGSSHVYTL